MSVEHYTEEVVQNGYPDTSEYAGAVLLDKITIIDEEPNQLLADIPLKYIYDDAAVESTLVDSLRKEIADEAAKQHNSGLRTPIFVAHIPEFEEGFPVMDGYHRVKAIQQLGHDTIRATVRLNSTWEDYLDERVKNTIKRHDPINFSRRIEWIGEAWEQRWAQETDISVLQAFTMTVNKTKGDGRLKLTPELAKEIDQWVIAKSKEWGANPATIRTDLSIAQNVDPEVVRDTRQMKGARTVPCLTPRHLRAISVAFPGKENFPLQRAVADAALNTNLSVAQFQTLIAMVRESGITDKDEAEKFIKKNIERAAEQTKALSGTKKTTQHSLSQEEMQEEKMNSEKLEAQLQEQLLAKQLELTVDKIERYVLSFGYTRHVTDTTLIKYFLNARPEALTVAREVFRPYRRAVTDVLMSDREPNEGDNAFAAYVGQILYKLPREDQDVITLKTFFGLSNKTITAILDRTPGQINDSLRKTETKVKEYAQSTKSKV